MKAEEYTDALRRKNENLRGENEELRAENERLHDMLEKEQEWRPLPSSGMSDKEYTELVKEKEEGMARFLTDAEARSLVSDEFGFRPEVVMVERTVPELEADRHRRVREKGKKIRNPMNVGYQALGYEMVNGDLERA